jgi:hypothetical protein
MSVIFKINAVDKSSEIEWSSFSLTRALTNQVDTLSFRVKRANSSGYKPALLDTIEITEGGVSIFGGQIVEMSESVDGQVEYVQCTAKDYAFDMDRKLVVQVYENMTVSAIINDIKNNVLPSGYDTTNVVCSVVIKYIAFNYEMPSKCFQQLAQIVDYDWYVNENKEIFFFLKGSSTAPFNLTDTNGKYVYNSLRINKDIKNLRNSIIVRGGTYEGNTASEEREADGDQITFLQAYKYSNIVVEVNGVGKTVGVDFINDPADYDVLYNFNEKAVKFREDNKPTAGQIVTVTGNPHIPVVTKLTDSVSIAQFGEFQYKIVDKSIGSKEAARDRARAEIVAWAQQINEGEFKTYSTGLKVGHYINIQSTNRSINQDFIISRITSKFRTHDELVHQCTLVTSQTYGMVEFLQKLLIGKDKEIVISQDEVLDSLIGLSDSFAITDSVTALAPTSGPYLWQPDASDANWNFATWG